jgi:Ca-activated chloride channel family protein
MNTKHVSHLIDDYIDGVLNAEDQKNVELHLQKCSQCQKEFSDIQSIVRDLHQLPKSITPPDKLQTAIDRIMLKYSTNHRLPQQRSAKAWNLLNSKWVFRIAAGFFVFIGTGIIMWFYLHKTADVEDIFVQKIETPSPAMSANPKPDDKIIVEIRERQKERKVRPEPIIPVIPLKKDVQLHAITTPLQQQPITAETVAVAQAPETSNQSILSKRPVNFGNIKGKVIDSVSGEPLIGANIVLQGTSIGVATDTNGEYRILSIPEGQYNVKVNFIGYKAQILANLSVKTDSSRQLDFRLSPQTLASEAVVVTAQRPVIKRDVTSSLVIVESKSLRSAQSNIQQFAIDGVRMPFESYKSFNTEDYSKIDENEFKDALSNPLSTFSIDVDAASYSNIRRFINNGQLPPSDAVRIEEMINYFKYDYPQPSDRHPFSVNTEVAVCPWNSGNNLLLIGLQGKHLDAEKLPPSNLVFLLDVSGSMSDPNKLPLVKAAFRILVQQLRSQDRVAVVVYAGNAGLVLPSTAGNERRKILDAIDKLEAGGSTAGGEGIKLAYKIARENFLKSGNNRVILTTDGDFNVGISSEGELMRLIEEERRDNIFLSVLGFGMGNYKDSKMEKLADRGNGNYAYIDDIQEARKVFGEQMAGTLYAIAKDVKIQIEFNPALIKSYRLIGYENRMLNKEDFKDDKKDAGELGAGHTVTALYEIVLNKQVSDIQPIDSLKYQTTIIKPESFRADELLTVKLRYKQPTDTTSILMTTPVKKSIKSIESPSRSFRFASAVAMFGMILRDSKEKANSNYDLVLQYTKESKGIDKEGYNTEFMKLVETCKLLDNRKGQ